MILNFPLLGAQQSISLTQLPLTRGRNKASIRCIPLGNIHCKSIHVAMETTNNNKKDVSMCTWMNVTDSEHKLESHEAKFKARRLSSECSKYLPFSGCQNHMLHSGKTVRAESFGNSNIVHCVYKTGRVYIGQDKIQRGKKCS